MLSRYDKKIIRITLNDGSIISGKAETLPSGYALDTFGIGKECIRIKDMHIFADDIANARSQKPSAIHFISWRSFCMFSDDLIYFVL